MGDDSTGVGRAHRVARMLEAGSIAVVGASERPGSFGLRLATEVLRSPSAPVVHLVHPSRRTVLGRPCVPSLAEVPGPVDLVLLGVPDEALVDQVARARERGAAGAVVFGSAAGLSDQLRAAAGDMALCGAGCMGFVNVARGIRAIGYLERSPLPAGGIAVVSHSGSVFSALLRTHRRLEYSLAVSSGQELVTTAADYLAYAVEQPETKVVGLFLETLRDVPRLRLALETAAERGIPVVAVTVGGSQVGRALVEAHSGALAGDDAAWEALFAAYGVHRAEDLDELVDSLEVLSIGRRVRDRSAGAGFASIHDSGAERVLVADVAQQVGVGFADLGPETIDRLRRVLGPGLTPANPLDVWSTGADTEGLFTECLRALAEDPAVDVVAMAVDLVPEYDGDDSYPSAVEAVWDLTDKPVVVLANLVAAVDRDAATRLRARGVPVLEGTRSGLRAVRHLLARPPQRPPDSPPIEESRQRRWAELLASGRLDHATSLALLADYGVATAPSQAAASAEAAIAAADAVGYPVVLKTDNPGVAHKAEAAGVVMGLRDATAVAAAYAEVTGRLGSRVSIQREIPAGVEVYVGLTRDPHLGQLVVVAPGGLLVETLGQRRVGLPPLDAERALALLDLPMLARQLVGASADSVVAAVLAVSQIGVELGHILAALDVNPLILTPRGAVAVDALIVAR